MANSCIVQANLIINKPKDPFKPHVLILKNRVKEQIYSSCYLLASGLYIYSDTITIPGVELIRTFIIIFNPHKSSVFSVFGVEFFPFEFCRVLALIISTPTQNNVLKIIATKWFLFLSLVLFTTNQIS